MVYNRLKKKMKKIKLFLGAILCVALSVAFVACSKTDCECMVSFDDGSYSGINQTISMNDYDGECSSISLNEIASHVGGYVDDPRDYAYSCYEK